MVEVVVSGEEADALADRLAYTTNEVRDGLEGLQFEPQPPLPDDLPSEVDASDEASDSRPGYWTSVEPSPGASKSPERNTSSSSEMQRNVRRAVEIIDESEASDTEEEISATAAASKEGAECTHWSEVMKRRRERNPAPTYFVNTLSQLSVRPVRGPRPFPEGFPEGIF